MRHPALLLAMAILPAAARAGVLVVGPPGGGAFPDIQSAVDAAHEGDVVVIKGSPWDAFVLRGKGLTLVGQPMQFGASPVIAGQVVISDVGAGQQVLLSHLQFEGLDGAPGMAGGHGLTLSHCAGSVRVSRCTLFGGRGSGVDGHPGPPQAGGHAIGVDDCQDVALVTCTLFGGAGGDNGPLAGPGGSALRIVDHSNVTLLGSGVTAGTGGGGWPASSETGGDGGAGVSLSQSTLFAGGLGIFAPINGGAGGAAITQWGPGGNGVEVDFFSLLRLKGAVPAGGLSQAVGGALPGLPGQPVTTQGGAVVTLPGEVAELGGVDQWAFPGETVHLKVFSLAGGSTLLLASLQGMSAWVGGQQSQLLVAPPWLGGVVPMPGGNLDFVLPPLPAGTDHVLLQLQPWVSGSGLGEMQPLLVLAQAP